MSALLRVESVSKHFGQFTAVDQVSLELEAGVLTSIIGPNGAGKTTLINVLTGDLPCDGGRVFLNGEEITRLPTDQRVRKGISRSFQITNIFPQMSVEQNVLLPLLARQGRTGQPFMRYDSYADTQAEAEGLLRGLGLWEMRDSPAGELAHGDQRRLEIGMAIAPNPRLCFLDEPTSGMNPLERTEVLEAIKGLTAEREVTFVVIEHDMDVVFSISERIVVMHRGEILADGTPDEIRENPEVREVYLGEAVVE
ncbi:MAG: ABC transporter ATP-binding protein [Anaerolineae bacterium]